MNMLDIGEGAIVNLDQVTAIVTDITYNTVAPYRIRFGFSEKDFCDAAFSTADERDEAFARLLKLLAKMEGVDEIDRL
jgi:hypothetical protein